mgnify:CR=1 FL=1
MRKPGGKDHLKMNCLDRYTDSCFVLETHNLTMCLADATSLDRCHVGVNSSSTDRYVASVFTRSPGICV